MNATKQFTWLFILITLACLGWYYNHITPFNHLDQERLVNSVDTTISNITVRQFNQQGTLIHRLNAPLMQHIQKDDVYLVKNPQITVSQENQPPWEISSQNAKSFAGRQQITFIGHVIVHQEKSSTTQESTFKSEKVTYFPKEKKANSDVLVTYEQPGNRVQSMGMNAYLDEKRVVLLHQARGRYVPSHA